MKSLQYTPLAAILIAWVGAQLTYGHSVYIEPDEADQLIIRFAEFESEPETSPGYLDQLSPVYAWTVNDEQPELQTAEKKRDCFQLSTQVEHHLTVQTAFPVMVRGSNPARQPNFYARWAPAFDQAIAPCMTLDIVPTGVGGQVRVYFRNQPLAGVALTLFTPEANDQDLTSDENGYVRFESDEKGLFMLKVGRHAEERVGFDRGQAFQIQSHNASLTWIQE